MCSSKSRAADNSLHLSQEFFKYVSCSVEDEIIHLDFPGYFTTLQKTKLLWKQGPYVQNGIRVIKVGKDPSKQRRVYFLAKEA